MKCFNYLKRRDNYDFLAFFITIIVVLVSFSLGQKMLFSDFNIMRSDLQGLYVPFYKLFVNKLYINGDLFTKARLFYSSLPAMGMDISSYVSCVSLLSPFNILYLLLDANLASIVLITLKLSLAAFFFQRLLRIMVKFTGINSVVFSVFYSLCGYSIAYYLNIHFLDGVYILPFVFECIYLFVTYKGKSIKYNFLLWFSYAYLFISCFYSAYLVGIISFLFFILLLYVSNELEKNKRLLLFFNYIKLTILAVLTTAFILLPAAVYVLSNKASDSTGYEGTTANLISIISNLFLGMTQSNFGFNPYLYSGLFTLILFPFFFLSKKINKRVKLLWGALLLFLALCCKIPFLYIFMHCFDSPDYFAYRFSYLISFVLIIMAAYVYKNVDSYNKYILLIEGLVLIIFYGLIYIFHVDINGSGSISLFLLEVNAIFIISYLAFLFFKEKKNWLNKIILLILFFEIVLNSYFVLINSDYDIFTFKEIYNKVDNQLSNAVKEYNKESSECNRLYLRNLPYINASLVYNNKSMQLFGSFENENYRKTQTLLGFGTSPRIVSDYGMTDITRMLYGYNYSADSYCIYINKDLEEAVLTKEDYSLPIGYLVSEKCSDINLSDNNPFINQNIVLSNFLGRNVDYYSIADVNLEYECDNSDILMLENGSYYLYSLDEAKEASATFSFKTDDEAFLYIPQEKSILYTGTPMVFSENGDEGNVSFPSLVSAPHIIKLGKNDLTNYSFNFHITPDMNLHYTTFKDIYVYTANNDMLADIYEELSANPFEIEKFYDGYIEGKVVVPKDKNKLFISIPYDNNWIVKVDGERREISPVINSTFISCDLPEGEHTIILEYNNKMFELGLIISVIGIILLVIDIYLTKTRRSECR